MVGLTVGGHVLAWGRACNGRLGSATPFDPATANGGNGGKETLTTLAMAATAAAVARGAGSAKGAPPPVLAVRLPYLDGLGTARGVDAEPEEEGAEAAPRVAAVACGGAHTLILCGEGEGTCSTAKRRAKRPAVAAQCEAGSRSRMLHSASGASDSATASGSSTSSRRGAARASRSGASNRSTSARSASRSQPGSERRSAPS